MRRIFTRWWFSPFAFLLVAGVGLCAFCWRYNVWSRDEWLVFQLMDEECHPVWRDFYYAKIRPGDNVEAVIAETHPSELTRSGDSVILDYYRDYRPGQGMYFTVVTAEARGGRMVTAYAVSCTWTRQFFDTVGEEDQYFGPSPYRQLRRGGAITIMH